MAHRVYLALGTNLGDRRANLDRAIRALGERVAIASVSPIYETEPVGVRDQPRFLNQAVSGSTELTPRELLAFAKGIEKEMGREPLPYRDGPRLIDVDILIYDDLVQPDADPALPHPKLHERAFVLAPLADIAPGLRHPALGKTAAELLEAVARDGVEPAGSAKPPPHPAGGSAGTSAPTASSLEIGGKTFVWGSRTYVVGILNVTPDSFSGDGLVRGGRRWIETAVEQGRRFVEEGADILDVGGESTRPGAEPVGAEEEMRRVLPVVEKLARLVATPISIDTSKARVADAALAAGATILNDVWGFRLDPTLAEVAARHRVMAILMHNRSEPKRAVIDPALGGRYVGVDYANLIEDVKRELGISIRLALEAGVPSDRIVLDPGIGFGKTRAQNLEILDRVGNLKALGYPILIGPSRKSFIGYTLGLPPGERIEGTAATVAVGIARGADLIRVHDVKEMVRVARMTDAIVRRPPKP